MNVKKLPVKTLALAGVVLLCGFIWLLVNPSGKGDLNRDIARIQADTTAIQSATDSLARSATDRQAVLVTSKSIITKLEQSNRDSTDTSSARQIVINEYDSLDSRFEANNKRFEDFLK